MKKTYIHLSVENELKKKLEALAKEKGLPLTSYIRMLLIEKVN